MNKNIHQITDGLYLTAFRDANIFLRNQPAAYHKYTSIVVAEELAPWIFDLNCKNIVFIPLQDHESENIYDLIPKVNLLIEQSKPCLICCVMGISRSASFCIAYLMKKFSLSFEDSFNYVQQKRNIICPNIGFINQLKKYGCYV